MIHYGKIVVEPEERRQHVRNGEHDAIIELLDEQAGFCEKLDRLTTPLHLAMNLQDDKLQRAVVATLLTKNIMLGTEKHDKNTALHLAVANGASSVITQLLAAGAPVNATGKKGQSPLHVAISIRDEKVALRVVKALLAAGADVGARDNQYNTALHIAMAREVGGIITELLLSIAPINEAGRNHKYPLHLATTMVDGQLAIRTVSKLLREGAIVDVKDGDRNTALHLAIEQERSEVVRVLIQNKADVNVPGKAGVTPHSAAMRLGPRGVGQVIAEMLEAAGAGPDTELSLASAEMRSRSYYTSDI